MKRIQIGNAVREPCCSPDIGLLSSYPTQTPVTNSGVNPMNQASTELLVVPVLPATGRPISRPARLAVPYCVTACIRSVVMYALV